MPGVLFFVRPVSRAIAPAGRRVAPAPVGHGLAAPEEGPRSPERRSGRERRRPPAGLQRGIGRQSGGAISKPSKRKPGATVQLTRVQAPRLVAVCQ